MVITALLIVRIWPVVCKLCLVYFRRRNVISSTYRIENYNLHFPALLRTYGVKELGTTKCGEYA